jgi:hypothetical protein
LLNPCAAAYPQLEIKPFTLHLLSTEEAHLCPIRALGEWLVESKITTGYLFRKIASGDRIAVNENRSMVCILFKDIEMWADMCTTL